MLVVAEASTLCWVWDLRALGWVQCPLSNSWTIFIIWLYIALKRTPNKDCYWGRGSTQALGEGAPTILDVI